MFFPLRLLRNLLVGLLRSLLNVLKLLLRPRGAVEFVRFELEAPLVLQSPGRRGRLLRFLLPARPYVSIARLGDQLDRLERDPRIAGIVLHIGRLDVGWGTLVTLRQRLEAFRAAGKRIVAYLREGENAEYYLGSVADRLFVPPGGHVWLTGVAAQVRFLKDALDKLPAEAEVFAEGKYKNAMDPLRRREMSPAHREALEAILDDLSAELQRAVAEGRRLDPGAVAERIAGGPYAPEEAKTHGLIDDIIFPDEVDDNLEPDAGEAPDTRRRTPRVGSYGHYRRWTWRPLDWVPLFRRRYIGYVHIEGVIHLGRSRSGLIGGATAGHETVCEALRTARAARSIRAVVVHIESRGGSSLASDLIWREMARLAEKKPVVAHLGDIAASGGYYIACGAHYILASPATITGSIGVIAGKVNIGGLLERLGIRTEVIRRGERADMLSPARALSEGERDRLAAQIAATYESFLARVAQGRKLERDAVHAVAQGRVWSGERARDLRLIDELGSVTDAVRRARSRAGFREEAKLPVVSIGPRPGLRPAIASLPGAALPAWLTELVDLQAIAADPTWTVAPFDLRVG